LRISRFSRKDEIGHPVGAKPAYIASGNPCENGFIESFNTRLRDELLEKESFNSLAYAKVVIESCLGIATLTGVRVPELQPAPEVFFPAISRGRRRKPNQLRRPH
jgi:putative transposase